MTEFDRSRDEAGETKDEVKVLRQFCNRRILLIHGKKDLPKASIFQINSILIEKT